MRSSSSRVLLRAVERRLRLIGTRLVQTPLHFFRSTPAETGGAWSPEDGDGKAGRPHAAEGRARADRDGVARRADGAAASAADLVAGPRLRQRAALPWRCAWRRGCIPATCGGPRTSRNSPSPRTRTICAPPKTFGMFAVAAGADRAHPRLVRRNHGKPTVVGYKLRAISTAHLVEPDGAQHPRGGGAAGHAGACRLWLRFIGGPSARITAPSGWAAPLSRCRAA